VPFELLLALRDAIALESKWRSHAVLAKRRRMQAAFL
jgi:hypothetical protein